MNIDLTRHTTQKLHKALRSAGTQITLVFWIGTLATIACIGLAIWTSRHTQWAITAAAVFIVAAGALVMLSTVQDAIKSEISRRAKVGDR